MAATSSARWRNRASGERLIDIDGCSVREVFDSLPEQERVAYTTLQTLVYIADAPGIVPEIRRFAFHDP
jgi:hypothetical protein